MTDNTSNPIFSDTLGSLLRTYRKDAKRTQLELAVDVHVDHSMISKWEKGVFVPNKAQLQTISYSLNLSDQAHDNLLFSWNREQHSSEHSVLALDSGALIESILTSIHAARGLRNAGNARIAEKISFRDASQAIDQIRAMTWGDHHEHMLMLASELMLENVKANLDFLTRDSVKTGGLKHQLNWLSQIEAASGEEKTKFFSALSREAKHYVGGDVTKAFENSQKLLNLELDIPLNWRLELLRASAINAGKIENKNALISTDAQIQRFLNDHTTNLTRDEHTFLLEGLSRGWASTDPQKALETIEKAWRMKNDEKTNSQLRFVQLVRTHAEIEKKYQSGVISTNLKFMIMKARQISLENGYDRYVDQLDNFLDGENEN